MKKNKIILFLFTIPLFLSTSFLKKTNTVEGKWKRTISSDFKGSSNLSEYEVRLTYTGYTTLYGTPGDCAIRKNGTVVLSGKLSGVENNDPDYNILYIGVLQLSIDMDICSVKRLPNGEDALCSMTVKGSGPVDTKLEIDTSSGGGYIKIEYQPQALVFNKSVVGSCDHKQLIEEEDMVPNKSIASIFNGKELPMLKDRTLRVGKYVEKDGDTETVVEVLKKVK